MTEHSAGSTVGVTALTVRGESPAAFDRRCIPPGAALGIVHDGSNTPGILPPHAWRGARLGGLGARRDFHHGLLTLVSVAALATLAGAQSVGVPDPDVAVARPVDIQCAPRAAWAMPDAPSRIVGSQEGEVQRMFGPGDAVVVSAGAGAQFTVGDEYYVRRQHRPRVESIVPLGDMPAVLHTAGWVRIIAVDGTMAVDETTTVDGTMALNGTMAVAVVSYACDGLLRGDYLEPYSVPVAPVGRSRGEVDYTDAARILFTEEGGYTAGIHRFAVIDRGRNANITPGQRFTLFREILGQQGPVNNLGEAFAVDVGERTATVRIFGTRDAVYAGDRLAVHR